jgi:DNA-directed RNA polymerase subunit RPC12/RpoP
MSEWWGKLRFIDPLRCLDCKTRFVAQTLVWSQLRYTRCPRCHRMDLNGWTGKTYTPPFWVAVKIVFGGRRYRCEYCRINFAAFRPRKEIFTFSRWKKLGFGPEGERDPERPEGAADETPMANDQTDGAHG